MNPPTPVHKDLVEALRLLLRAERHAMHAADIDLDAILVVAAIQSAAARLMLVCDGLERDADAGGPVVEPARGSGQDDLAACTRLLTGAADRLDSIRASTSPAPHGLLFARAALSQALHECDALGSVS